MSRHAAMLLLWSVMVSGCSMWPGIDACCITEEQRAADFWNREFEMGQSYEGSAIGAFIALARGGGYEVVFNIEAVALSPSIFLLQGSEYSLFDLSEMLGEVSIEFDVGRREYSVYRDSSQPISVTRTETY